MPFSLKTKEKIAFRAAYICSNPDCNTLTVGPSIDDPNLVSKKGEAAHIVGEKARAPRHDEDKVDINDAEKAYGYVQIAML